MFLDMSSVVVEASNFTRAGRTCRAAMGFSFAAGTTDGAHNETALSACATFLSQRPGCVAAVS